MPHDPIIAVLAVSFAAFSFAYPWTASSPLIGGGFFRGYLVGAVFLVLAATALLLPFIDPDSAPIVLRFIRFFYPQAFVVLFFQESILLSVELGGGRAYDQAFARFDRAIFGFQPSHAFHQGFESMPWFNELMFGSYFLYYVLLAITPWMAWLSGRVTEAARQVFVISGMMAIVFLFYIFFRVEGPKYWFADLRSLGYEHFRGGPFVEFFKGVFRSSNLYGAAFPSTHVAFSVALTILAGRFDRRLTLPYVVASVLVSLSTVYIYAHYVADVLGGVVAALVLVPILFRLFEPASAACARMGAGSGGAKR